MDTLGIICYVNIFTLQTYISTLCLDEDEFYYNSDKDTGDNNAGDNNIVDQSSGGENTGDEISGDDCNEEGETVDVGRGAGSCNDGEIKTEQRNHGITLMMVKKG